MRPFAVEESVAPPVVIVDPVLQAKKIARYKDFFVERGLTFPDDQVTAALPTFSPVTSGTETGIPPNDSDEKTYNNIDD
jgi:hypothetical protein